MCGSGGCTAYVVTRESDGMKVTSSIGPAQLPIVALDKGEDGWTDLGVQISGGGSKPALMRLSHGPDGYPRNPTVAPATEVSGEAGTVLIADEFDSAKPVPQPAKPPLD